MFFIPSVDGDSTDFVPTTLEELPFPPGQYSLKVALDGAPVDSNCDVQEPMVTVDETGHVKVSCNPNQRNICKCRQQRICNNNKMIYNLLSGDNIIFNLFVPCRHTIG